MNTDDFAFAITGFLRGDKAVLRRMSEETVKRTGFTPEFGMGEDRFGKTVTIMSPGGLEGGLRSYKIYFDDGTDWLFALEEMLERVDE